MRIHSYASGRDLAELHSGDAFVVSGVTISPIARGHGFQVACMRFGPGGLIGRHDATVPQLFVVADGDGWVSGEDGTRRPIGAGEAAFWVAGESHESGSERGMSAFVLEATALKVLMPGDDA